MLTISDEDEDLFEAIKNGAQGYLLKNLNPEELLIYMADVLEGKADSSHPLCSTRIDVLYPGMGEGTSQYPSMEHMGKTDVRGIKLLPCNFGNPVLSYDTLPDYMILGFIHFYLTSICCPSFLVRKPGRE